MTINQLTFPTAEKKSSRSRALILAASCMQKTVRASLSSGVRLSIGALEKKKTEEKTQPLHNARMPLETLKW